MALKPHITSTLHGNPASPCASLDPDALEFTPTLHVDCSPGDVSLDIESHAVSPILEEVADVSLRPLTYPQVDSDNASESSDENIYDSCSNYHCVYGGSARIMNRNRDELLWCDKCIASSWELCMCRQCMRTGAHARHKQYLKPKSDCHKQYEV